MKDFEQIKDAIEKSDFHHLAFNLLETSIGQSEAALRQKGEIEFADKVKAFHDAIYAFSAFPVEPGAIHPDLAKDYKAAYDKMAGFKAFLEEKDPEGKTGCQKLIEVMSQGEYDLFVGGLEQANEDLGLEIDLKSLPQYEAAAKEDKAAARNEEEVQTLSEDDLADIDGPLSSAAYIENLRDKGFAKKDPAAMSEEEKEVCLDRMLRIMAARELADSERGDKSKLVSFITNPVDVNDRAAAMKNDKTFKRFLQELKDDPAKMKAAISAAAKRPGHGGGLDDMFKTFVKNQPSIRMNNNALLKRYMPTVKERLEILQKQSESYKDKEKELASTNRRLNKLQNKGSHKNEGEIKRLSEKVRETELWLEEHGKHYIASEMIVLRNLAQAHKGKKASLDKPIPVSDVKEKTIFNWVNPLSDRSFMKSDAVISLIGKGHGGEMMAKARELANASDEFKPMSATGELTEEQEEVLGVFNANTIKTRISKIEEEAGSLENKLRDAILRGHKKDDLMKQCKDLLAESLLLDGKVRNPETGEMDETKLQEDVPWLDIEKMQKNGPENNKSFEALLGEVTPEDMLLHLERLNQNGQDAFIMNLAAQKTLRTKDIDAVSEASNEIFEEHDMNESIDSSSSSEQEYEEDVKEAMNVSF